MIDYVMNDSELRFQNSSSESEKIFLSDLYHLESDINGNILIKPNLLLPATI